MSLDLTTLNAELGAYHRKHSKRLGRLIYQENEMEQYMASVPGVTDQWVGGYGTIGNLLQPHQPGWVEHGQVSASDPGQAPGMVAGASGKGSAEIVFKPVSHQVKPIDIKVSFDNLEAVMTSWLGFLTDENEKKSDWPLVRYISEALLIPKANEELGEIACRGNFVAPTAGVPGLPLTSADGVLTIIADQITATNISPIASGAFTSSNIFANVESFVKSIPSKYRKKNYNLYMSDTNQWDLVTNYRDEFGGNAAIVNGNELTVKIGNTMIKTIGISGFATSNRFLYTPKDNMKKLFNKIDQIEKFYVQNLLGKLYLFLQFRRGYGFDRYEEVFVNDQA